jgi:hypothetical protein
MITITSFTEANHLYQQQRIPWRLLQDQAAVLVGSCQNPHHGVADARDIAETDIAWLLQQPESLQPYADLLGGNVSVCQEEIGLQQIQGCDFDWADAHDGKWPNVTDTPLGFDQCSYVEESEGQPQWVLFLTCWSDAGGPVYYVPRNLWDAARVSEHMALTNQYWQGGQ